MDTRPLYRKPRGFLPAALSTFTISHAWRGAVWLLTFYAAGSTGVCGTYLTGSRTGVSDLRHDLLSAYQTPLAGDSRPPRGMLPRRPNWRRYWYQ
jgi:hypothetical protein